MKLSISSGAQSLTKTSVACNRIQWSHTTAHIIPQGLQSSQTFFFSSPHIYQTHVDPINAFSDTPTVCDCVERCSWTKSSLFLLNVKFKNFMFQFSVLCCDNTVLKVWLGS